MYVYYFGPNIKAAMRPNYVTDIFPRTILIFHDFVRSVFCHRMPPHPIPRIQWPYSPRINDRALKAPHLERDKRHRMAIYLARGPGLFAFID